MKLKHILLTSLLAITVSFGFAAEQVAVAPTPAPTVTETVVTTVKAVAADSTDKAIKAVTDGATSALKDGASTVSTKVGEAVAVTKSVTATVVEKTTETVNDIAPPKVRGEFMSLVVEKIRKYSTAGENAVSLAIDEVKEQTPLVVKEYLRWHLAQNLFYIVVTLGLTIYSLFLFKRYFPLWLQSLTESTDKHKTTEVDVRQFKYGATGILSGITSVVLVWIVLSHLEWYLNSLKITIAPRVYLIEQVAEFIRQISAK